MTDYQPIIGLEVHVELATKSKMFCGCPADHFGKKPNTQTCPVCLGLPGALPVPNRKAVEWTILLGLALNCTINEESKFDRKHYFYPDLPKGYQISQYDMPLCVDGQLVIARTPDLIRGTRQSHVANKQEIATPAERTRNDKVIRIRRVHLEEDTGKLMHETVDLPADATHQALQAGGQCVTLVDFNRSGVALVEIVTEPDFRSVEEVDIFVKNLQQIIRYVGVSRADMEKGSMRIEPSISVERQIELRSESNLYKSRGELPSYRVELKNINSFRFVRKALEYEIARQTELLERGEKPTQQTRGWNEGKGATVSQREKEEAHDYRYFPEPDIPPMKWEQLTINNLQLTIPELPDEKNTRFMKEYGLNEYDAGLVTETRERAEYFEEAMKVAISHQPSAISQVKITPKAIANWLINRNIDIEEVLPAQLIERILKASQVATVSDEDLEKIIHQVLRQNQKAVQDYKKGKEQALMFLVGQVKRIHQHVDTLKIIDIIKRSIEGGFPRSRE